MTGGEGFLMRVPMLVTTALLSALWGVTSVATGSQTAGVVVVLLAVAGLAADGMLAVDIRYTEMELRRTLERLDFRRVAWSPWDGEA